MAGQGGNMGQTALFPAACSISTRPFVITGPVSGPEFQILTTATALSRANWVNSFVFGSLGATTTVIFSACARKRRILAAARFAQYLMLHGTMSADMRNGIMTALQAVPAGRASAAAGEDGDLFDRDFFAIPGAELIVSTIEQRTLAAFRGAGR